jgi:phosphoribosylglycinamide formyltransferase-1
MITEKPRILVFASGTKTGGGSGFEVMVEATRSNPPRLNAEIAAVVSNHENGGVREKADRLKIPFRLLKVFNTETYRNLCNIYQADYVMLSGWLKLVAGLDPARTINIHPGPLPQFGGDGMYGHHVHEAVLASYRRGEITSSAVTMHFVDEVYDRGPVFFQHPVKIEPDDTLETLVARVNRAEHEWQSRVLNYVVHGLVRLGFGKVVYATRDLRSMLMPAGYDKEIHVVAETHVNPTLR